jgi:hypothetical protein
MIKILIKFVISVMAISWLAKKMRKHFHHDERRMEPIASKLKRYMEK